MSKPEVSLVNENLTKNKKEKVITSTKKEVDIPIKNGEQKVNMSRRYFTIGLFASVFLFKKNLINPSYQISRTGKFTLKLSMFFYRILKFLLWSSKKK